MTDSIILTPAQEARRIVEAHIPEDSPIRREALAEDIRWTIIQQRSAARQAPELQSRHVPEIVTQILFFVDEYCRNLHGRGYPAQANALQDCRRRVLALHGIEAIEAKTMEPKVERKPVASEMNHKRKAVRA